jgi:hypothetical protein
MVHCDRCRAQNDTICPVYITVVYMLTTSGADQQGVLRRSIDVIPGTITLYLCQLCNRNHTDHALAEGPMNQTTMNKWLTTDVEPKGVAES